MIIFKKATALQDYLQKHIITKSSIGFIPTMGALHRGHISLLKKSKQIADKTLCSIFVNPSQFNNPDDFKKYPVKTEQDIFLLEKTGCDVLFLPDIKEIYPHGFNKESFNLGNLENILEGKFRPDHFQGVGMVVKNLIEIINPTYLLAGQKDYQQCLVLQRILQFINSGTELIICPTVRENDGLAMSSRNLRLNEKQRALAPEIYHTLSYIKQHIKPGSLKHLKDTGINLLTKKGFRVDYVEIAGTMDLQTVDVWDGSDPVIILAAAYINDIRLIDNLKS
ncbi:MAG: pantoate--beta-alanine ligase [Ginsengibacter sp.]